MFDGLISRLPIYTRTLDVFGYELKFCSGAAWRSGQGDDAASFGDCLIQASRSLPLDDLTGGNPTLIRLPVELLSRCEEVAWPRERLMFAVPEPAIVDDALRDTIRRLASRGVKIAVDDPSRDLTLLRRQAGYVSLCSLAATATAGLKGFNGFAGSGDRPSLLVRELETADQYDFFQRLGFDYYEGAYFVRPRLRHGTEIPADRLAALQLLARLQNPDVDMGTVEELVSHDLTLSYKLLRLINSAYFGMPKRVESIRRAVTFLGLQRLKNWVSVVLVNAVDFRPRELLTTALVRAQTCESLARALGRQPVEAYYVTGLFSLLDAIMDAPMSSILERLSLAESLNQALLRGEGPIGEVLQGVLALERGEFFDVSLSPATEPTTPTSAYLSALAWASEVQRQLR